MSTLAERVKIARDSLNYSQSHVAKLAGLSQQGYQDIESGKSKRPRNIEKLASILQVTPEFLIFGTEITIPVHLIPLLSWSEAPYPSDLSILDRKEGVLPMANHAKGNCYALTIKDDSMTSKSGDRRSFLEGDIIIIDPHLEPKHGSYVIVREANTSEAILKQYLVHGSNIILSSLNDRYPAIQYHIDNIKICGVVIKKQEDIEKVDS